MQKEKKGKNINKYFLIDWIQLFALCLTAPLFLFPSIDYIWPLLIVPLIWILRKKIKNEFFKRTPLDWAVVVLLIQVFFTCITVPDIFLSLPKIAGVLFGVFFFYSIVALLNSEKLIKYGIAVFLVGGLILSVISVVDMAGFPIIYFNKLILKISEKIPKIDWNLPGAERGINANALAGILVLIFPLCLFLLFPHLKRKKENYLISNKLVNLIFLFLVFLVIGSVIFLTQSKAGWTGLIISIWILFFPRKLKRISVLVALLLAIFIFSTNIVNPKLIIDEARKDILEREPWLEVGVQTVIDHPFFGIGMNHIRKIPEISYASHVHNHFLHTAAELGIPALIAYLTILIGAGYMYYHIWQNSKSGWMKIAAQGFICGQLAHFIFGISDSIPLGAKPGIFFWLSLGLITAIYNFTIKSHHQ